jgi:hypothetical protein
LLSFLGLWIPLFWIGNFTACCDGPALVGVFFFLWILVGSEWISSFVVIHHTEITVIHISCNFAFCDIRFSGLVGRL